MNSENHRLQFLLQSLIDHTITKQELEELAELLKQSDDNEAVNAQMRRSWESNEPPLNNLDEGLYAKIVNDSRFIAAAPKKQTIIAKLTDRNALRYYAAAAILICCFLGLYLYRYQALELTNKSNTSMLSHAKGINEQNDHVVLTLSNGKKLVLDQAANGHLGNDKNALISKTKDGQIVYNLGNIDTDNSGELAYNAISTPVGGTYQLILSDGTKVWLNSKSTLKFPVAFSKTQRNVELVGEGYFEVAHDQTKPFMVSAKDMDIQVLGTHFNVSAYDDDNMVEASLIEGSIKANNGNSAMLLKPGQQAVLRNGSSQMIAKSFNSDEVMDWKNGYFIFRNEPIGEIMKKISRWYNIEVKYQGNTSNEAFGGKYLKSNSLAELLSSLELTGTVKFKINGRRVTVMQ